MTRGSLLLPACSRDIVTLSYETTEGVAYVNHVKICHCHCYRVEIKSRQADVFNLTQNLRLRILVE
jgi:hypothetical protein